MPNYGLVSTHKFGTGSFYAPFNTSRQKALRIDPLNGGNFGIATGQDFYISVWIKYGTLNVTQLGARYPIIKYGDLRGGGTSGAGWEFGLNIARVGDGYSALPYFGFSNTDTGVPSYIATKFNGYNGNLIEPTGGFDHWEVNRTSGVITFSFNGQTFSNNTISFNGPIGSLIQTTIDLGYTDPSYKGIYVGSEQPYVVNQDNGAYIDDFFFARDVHGVQNTLADGSINDGKLATTALLYKFDGNYTDTTTNYQIADPITLSSSFSLVAQAITSGVVKSPGVINLQVTTSVTATFRTIISRYAITGTKLPGPVLQSVVGNPAQNSSYHPTGLNSLQVIGSFVNIRSADNSAVTTSAQGTDGFLGGVINISYPYTGGYDTNQYVNYYHFANGKSMPNNWLTSTYNKTNRDWSNGSFVYPGAQPYPGSLTLTAPDFANTNPQVADRTNVELFGPGTFGRSIPFDHYERNPSGPKVLSGSNGKEWTWSFWFKYDTTDENSGNDYWKGRTLFGFWGNRVTSGSGDYGYFCAYGVANVQISTTGRLEFVCRWNDYSPPPYYTSLFVSGSSFYTDQLFGSASGLADGAWHHIVCSGYSDRNTGTRTIKLYVDGQEKNTYGPIEPYSYAASTTYGKLQRYGYVDYEDATDFHLLPHANFVKNNPETYNATQSWWTRNLTKDPISLAEIFWDDRYVDLTQESTRNNFYIDSTSVPSLGQIGQIPTGRQPLVYHRKNLTNLGRIGDFVPGNTVYQDRFTTGVSGGQIAITYYNLGTIVEFLPVTLSVTTTVTALAGKIKGTTVNLLSTATIQAQVSKLVKTTAQLTATTQLVEHVRKNVTTTARLNSTTTWQASCTKGLFGISHMSSASQFTATAKRYPGVTANLQAQTQQQALVLRIKQLSSTLQALSSELTVVSRVGRTLVDMRSTTLLTAQVIANHYPFIPLDSTTTLAVTPNRIRNASAQLSATTITTANNGHLRPGAASLHVTTQVTADVKRLRKTSVVLASNTQIVAHTENSRRPGTTARLSSASRLTVTNQIARLAQAHLQVTSSVLSTAGVVVFGYSHLQAFSSELIYGRLIDIDPFTTIQIKQESRGLKVLPESRIISINQESRVNIIKDLL